VAEPESAPAPGWREVLVIAGLLVGLVFAVQVGTSLLPPSIQSVVFHSPLAIVVLAVGTIILLIRIARRPSA